MLEVDDLGVNLNQSAIENSVVDQNVSSSFSFDTCFKTAVNENV